MQGFDKLGNSISSAIKAPLETARNETIAEYYQSLKDANKQIQANKDAKFYNDGMQEILDVNKEIEADNKQIQANKDAKYKAQMKDQAAIARKMAHIAAMQKSIETMQANDDIHTHKELMKAADTAMNVQFEDNVPYDIYKKGGKQ